MKKSIRILFAVLAIVSISVACSKEIDISNSIDDNSEETSSAVGKITIKATLPDALTRVSFTQGTNSEGNPILKLAWEENDKLLVADNADPTNPEKQAYFVLDASCIGTTEGVFTGTPATEGPYDVSVVHGNNLTNPQHQPADGDTSGLEYVASAVNVSDLSAIEFQSVSSVLALQAKLPADIASTVNSVTFKSNEAIFSTGNTLTVSLTTAGVNSGDAILDVFATLAPGDVAIPVGTVLIVEFGTTTPKYITRYHKFTAAAEFKSGKYNSLKLKCVNLTSTASDCVLDGNGTEGHAYEIGDKFQMDAMHGLMFRGQKTYCKLIDNIDMTGIVWYPLNNGYPKSGGTKYTGNIYDKELDFNGNNKEISNLETKSSDLTDSDEYASVFGVLMGNIYDLTINHATIHPQGKSGILAGWVGTGSYGPNHCEVTNVKIKNSTLTEGASYCGALAGQSAKNGNVFSNIEITNCTISTTSYAAGLVAYFANSATVSDISVKDTDVSSTGSSNATTPVPQDGIAGGIAAVVKAAVDFDRCKYENATITGPKNTNASPSTNSRYIGGLAGYVYNYATTFDDCEVNSVELALDAAGSNNNGRYMGGAFGYIGSSVVVGEDDGCTVTDLSGNSNIRNYVAGFIGYNDGGTIYNSSAAGSITSRGGLGGFVAVTKGGTYINDMANVTISGVGNLGGFAGITETKAPVMNNCSASGDVTATGSYAGGFVGNSAVGKFYSCSASGNVSSTAAYSGGFAGCILDGEIEGCSASGSVSSTGNFAGGFSGGTGDPGTGIGGTVSIDKSMASGNAQGNSTVSGFVAYAIDGVLSISDSFATGNMLGNARRRGGLIAWVENADVTVTNCYVTGSIVGSFEIGGLVGLLSTEKLKMSNSAAWNSSITAGSIASNNWSSAAVVGVTYLTSTLTDNYRSPDMQLTAYWGNAGGYGVELTNAFQHPNVSASAPLTDPNGNAVTSSTMRPYQGKCEAGKTLSQLASTTLGWSGDVWDFSGPLPLLK